MEHIIGKTGSRREGERRKTNKKGKKEGGREEGERKRRKENDETGGRKEVKTWRRKTAEETQRTLQDEKWSRQLPTGSVSEILAKALPFAAAHTSNLLQAFAYGEAYKGIFD